MRLLVGLLLCSVALADDSLPGAPKASKCESPSPAVAREIERLLKSAAEHATLSHVCADGDGEKTTLALTRACVQHPAGRPNTDVIGLQLQIRYHVVVQSERSGECSPYPACAQAPPASERNAGVEIAFSGSADGFALIVPTALPGVPLKTPLARKHSMGCYGDSAAFVPRKVKN